MGDADSADGYHRPPFPPQLSDVAGSLCPSEQVNISQAKRFPLEQRLIGRRRQMLVHSKNLSEGILAELPEMRAFARLMMNDRHEADDEVAAALTLAMSDKDGLRRRDDLRLSLFAILRKCIAQHDRKPSSDARAVLPAEGDSTETSVSGMNRAPVTAIDKAVMQLSSEEREAIILSVAAEFPVREIAIICECSLTAVESRLHGAGNVLRRRKSTSVPSILQGLMLG
jgi:RNA polymerase sigma-70 factor (ECF subfamily)